MSAKPRKRDRVGRAILGTLREIVQEIGRAAGLEEALGILVRRVREEMGVDVCSAYLRQPGGDELILQATVGLASESVGNIRLPIGEGLVGLVAQTRELVNVEEAAAHPSFRYFPESGESAYHAFLGVPVMRYGDLTGVLVVQDRARRRFVDSEVDFLVTVSAQLDAVLSSVAAASLVAAPPTGAPRTVALHGIAGAPGVAIGTLVADVSPSASRAEAGATPVDPEEEIAALERALVAFHRELDENALRVESLLPADVAPLFDVYRLMLRDEALLDSVRDAIAAGRSAAAALQSSFERFAAVFDEMEDPYQRARAVDVRAIGERLLRHLSVEHGGPREYPERTVLVGAEVALPRILEVPPDRLAAILCSAGSVLSHTVVVARAFGVPAVLGLSGLSGAALDGRQVVVDGFTGEVWIDPSDEIREAYVQIESEEREIDRSLESLKDLPCRTPDGFDLPLLANVGLRTDVERSHQVGVEGVGLYRSEFLFMLREAFPSEDEQYAAYRELLESFAPRPVTIRTLDIGGDKPLPYFPIVEANAFLGWRGIRFTLDHPEVFLTQLRALLRADVGLGNLRLLLPMVSRLEEVREARRLLDQALAELRGEGHDATSPPLGVLVEVPSVAYQLPDLAPLVDFFSIGTNDLTQYLLAVDRSSRHVADLYDSFHPAVVRVMRQVVEGARSLGVPVGVCGQIAGDPTAALLLLGLGVDWLSMAPSAAPRVKQVVRAFSRERAKEIAEAAIVERTADETREVLEGAIADAGLTRLARPARH